MYVKDGSLFLGIYIWVTTCMDSIFDIILSHSRYNQRQNYGDNPAGISQYLLVRVHRTYFNVWVSSYLTNRSSHSPAKVKPLISCTLWYNSRHNYFLCILPTIKLPPSISSQQHIILVLHWKGSYPLMWVRYVTLTS